jgi:hypothetical protein
MSAPSPLRELQVFKRQLETAQVCSVECQLFASKSTIYSRYPNRRNAPSNPSMNQFNSVELGSGISISPEPIDDARQLATAIPLYDRNQEPVVNSAGDPLFKSAGWNVSYFIAFRGNDAIGVQNIIGRINDWAWRRRSWLQDIELIPKDIGGATDASLLWADVVLRVGEQTHNPMLKPNSWYVVVQPYLSVNLNVWMRRNQPHYRPIFERMCSGLSKEDESLIGDEPEDIEACREDFIGDSIAVIDWILDRNQPAKFTSSDPSDADNGDGLPMLALKAVMDGGDPGLINQAMKVPAKTRYSTTMMKMLDGDPKYFEWGLEDWAIRLGGAKKTILATDAWRRITEYREQNKQDRAVK